jgi:hypothetical protein
MLLDPEVEQLLRDVVKRTAESFAGRLQVLRDDQEVLTEELVALRQQLLAEMVYRKGKSQALKFSSEAGASPVVVFDLHGTLTPDRGFPLRSDPWKGVKAIMDELVASNVTCICATAGMSPYHQSDVIAAREQQSLAWFQRFGLPIKMVVGKVGAHVYYDDRMVYVPPVPDWFGSIRDQIYDQLSRRAEKGKDGMWRLIDLPDIGKAITDFPGVDEVPGDAPRGLSTPILDVDLHRCVFQSNSSKFESSLRPGAKDVVNEIYDLNFTVHTSCAGWDPATHTDDISGKRLRGLQRSLRTNGVKYDSMVSKLHGTVFVDDKGFTAVDWKADRKGLLQRMGQPLPEDEITVKAKTEGGAG